MLLKQYRTIQLWSVGRIYVILNFGVYEKYTSKHAAQDAYTNLISALYPAN